MNENFIVKNIEASLKPQINRCYRDSRCFKNNFKMNKKKILIDLIPFHPTDAGFSTRVHNLLRVCQDITDIEIYIICSKNYEYLFNKYKLNIISVRIHKKLRYFLSQVLIPFYIWKYGFVALHCEIGPLPIFTRIASSVTVHDLFFLKSRSFYPISLKNIYNYLYWNCLYVYTLRLASVVICISETTKRDVLSLIGSNIKTALIFPLIDTSGIPLVKNWDERDCLSIVFLGSIVPRKNLKFLLLALEKLNIKWKLNIIGNLWWGSDFLSFINDERIQVHGYLDEIKKNEIIGSSHVMILPSIYEGFGVPAAEAITMGCLAIGSKGSAFEEYLPSECTFELNDPENINRILYKMNQFTYNKYMAESYENVSKYNYLMHFKSYNNIFNNLINDK